MAQLATGIVGGSMPWGLILICMGFGGVIKWVTDSRRMALAHHLRSRSVLFDLDTDEEESVVKTKVEVEVEVKKTRFS